MTDAKLHTTLQENVMDVISTNYNEFVSQMLQMIQIDFSNAKSRSEVKTSSDEYKVNKILI